jgi:hypothetical protein
MGNMQRIRSAVVEESHGSPEPSDHSKSSRESDGAVNPAVSPQQDSNAQAHNNPENKPADGPSVKE